MLSFLPKNPNDIIQELKVKFKKKRKELGYTQQELATRSGVSMGSVKRFEGSGQISLESLLKLAFVLECLGDFEKVCEPKERMPKSIEDLL
ncbi:MAG: helix-turn-helix transcriptional regulator [Epsilonproteobacteria bacterium]|nr:helix-turn-helix transcriptional regulator [Campylobacterota bacterium]